MAVLCSVCSVKMSRNSDHLQCISCKKLFHLKCGNKSVDEFIKMRDDNCLNSWKCEVCVGVSIEREQQNGGAAIIGRQSDQSINNSPCREGDDNDKDKSRVAGCDCAHELRAILESQNHIVSMFDCMRNDICILKEENRKLRETLLLYTDAISGFRDEVVCLKSNLDDDKIGCNDVGGDRQMSLSNRTLATASKMNPPMTQLSSCGQQGQHDNSNASGPLTEPTADDSESVSLTVVAGQSSNVNCEIDAEATKLPLPQQKQGSKGKQDWKTVSYRKAAPFRPERRKKMVIIGSTPGTSNVQAAPRKFFLHVTRLSPNTCCEDLHTYLKPHFPEVVCEQLNSKYPGSYASFKLCINFDNIERAMKPEMWPVGTRVCEFFQRRIRPGTVN